MDLYEFFPDEARGCGKFLSECLSTGMAMWWEVEIARSNLVINRPARDPMNFPWTPTSISDFLGH